MPFRDSISEHRRIWLGVLFSVAVVVAIVAVLPADKFLSAPDTDMIGQEAAWRAFAADNIKTGHFPLWNPYDYGGQPFLGDFQSAEFYPPNVVYLFLPLARAVNLSYLLHLLLLGWGMGFWVTRRGGHPLAGLLAGLGLALSGPVFLRLYSGHLTHINTVAWSPWMFCALETSWRSRPLRPLLLAAACVCLQILGGSPQYVFYIAIAAGIHAVVYSLIEPAVRRRALPFVAMVYLCGAALAAAQLLPGLAASAEGVRQDKLAFGFARLISFPPESLLTTIAPDFFGNLSNVAYWGRYNVWETSAFVGVTGLVLAMLAPCAAACRRWACADWLIVAALFILALGDHTPVFRLLYDYAPFFGQFRGTAKFLFPTALFLFLNIGAGADAVIRGQLGPKPLALGLVFAGLVTFGLGYAIENNPGYLESLWTIAHQDNQSYVPTANFANEQFLQIIGLQACHGLMIGGWLFLASGVSLLLAHFRPACRWAVLVLYPLEMLFFAEAHLGTASLADVEPPGLAKYIAAHPGDYRVLNRARPENGYFLHAPDLWGDNPFALKRYAEFIASTQNVNLQGAGQYMSFTRLPKIFALLRFRIAYAQNEQGRELIDNPGALPHALLVTNYEVKPPPNRDAILAELNNAAFDPTKTVLLESEPSPQPQPNSTPGNVNTTVNNSDSLTFDVETPAPALLLITDLYSRDWHARPLPGSVQSSYEILPADYIVRAIPLSAGHHHLVVEYAPASLRLGLIVSGLAWLAWMTTLVFTWRSRGEKKNPLTP